MLGAIAGDFVGSRHEFSPTKSPDFELMHRSCHWTDDTVCTVAVADAFLNGEAYSDSLRSWTLRYPVAGYGPAFFAWANTPDAEPYGSWGNGSAMRVSPLGWLTHSMGDAAFVGAVSASPTHGHHHGMRGAKATAVAVRMALEGWTQDEIRALITDRYGYDLSGTPDSIRPGYRFEVSCQKSVPQALVCALRASSWEEAVRMAVSLGGDADTQAAVAGAVAEPLFGVPSSVREHVLSTLPEDMLAVHRDFAARVAGEGVPGSWMRSDPAEVERDPQPPARSDEATGMRSLDAVQAVQESLSQPRVMPRSESWLARTMRMFPGAR